MGNMRIPSISGSDITPPIDSGTLSRSVNLPPRHFMPDDFIQEWVEKQIREGNFDALGRTGDLAYKRILKKLEELGDDFDKIIRIIASLPDGLSKQVGYNFFAAFFDHYLPKRFLENYVWGKGKRYNLTLQEFTDCNPNINIRNAEKFESLYKDAENAPGRPLPFNKLKIKSWAYTNGTLGQFHTRATGQLVAQPNGTWHAKGTMDFDDLWDFDPKNFSTGGRSFQGEVKTRVGAALLPGHPFRIFSIPETDFIQSDSNVTVVWAGGNGGKPKFETDRIGALDHKIVTPEIR